MYDEDFLLQSIQSQVNSLLSAYFRLHPGKLKSPDETNKILDRLSSLLQKQETSPQLIEYDFNKPNIRMNSVSFMLASEHNESVLSASMEEQQHLQRHQNFSQRLQNQQFPHNYDQNFRPSPSSQEIGSENNQRIQEINSEQGEAASQGEKKIQGVLRGNSYLDSYTDYYKLVEQPPKYHSLPLLDELISIKKEEILEESQNQSYTYEHKKIAKKIERIRINRKIIYKKIHQNKGRVKNENYIKLKKNGRYFAHQSQYSPSKKGRKPQFPKMEATLVNWIKCMCQQNFRVTQVNIREMAIHILKSHPQYQNSSDFRASKGWIQKFFNRHNEITKLLKRRKSLIQIPIKAAQPSND